MARALLLKPRLLIADEPVSMVDASLRATILETLRNLQRDHGVSIIYITHDLTTAYHIAKSIIVLYRGAVMEAGDVDASSRPAASLYAAAGRLIPWPNLDQRWGTDTIKAREAGGSPGLPVPSPLPDGDGQCATQPPLFQIHPTQAAACYLHASNPRSRPNGCPNCCPSVAEIEA